MTPETVAALVAKAKAFDNALSLWGTLGWTVPMALTLLPGLLARRERWVQRIPKRPPRIRRLAYGARGTPSGVTAPAP